MEQYDRITLQQAQDEMNALRRVFPDARLITGSELDKLSEICGADVVSEAI